MGKNAEKVKKYSSIIVVGSLAYDEILVFPGKFVDYINPEKLHQLNVSFVVDNMDRQVGGIATNICYNFRLVDKSFPVIPVGAIGKDAAEFQNFFAEQKISDEAILIDKTVYSATGKAITDKDDNQIWGYYYGPLKRAAGLDLSKFADKNSLIVLSATHRDTFEHFQSQAIEMGVDYMYDVGMCLSWISDQTLYEGVDGCRWLVGNDYEIDMILARVRKHNRRLVAEGIDIITTLGAKGVRYESQEGVFEIPSYTPKQVVDPTGAGDSWRGGFLSGVIEGKPVKDCLIRANALASFAVEKMGTINHKPKMSEIESRIGEIEKISNNQ